MSPAQCNTETSEEYGKHPGTTPCPLFSESPRTQLRRQDCHWNDESFTTDELDRGQGFRKACMVPLPLPGNGVAPLNVVPVDFVVEAVWRLSPGGPQPP